MLICLIALLLPLPDSVLTLTVESDAGPFRQAVSMARTPDGAVLVADQGTNNITVWNEQNALQRAIGGTGEGTDAFGRITDVSSSFLLDIFVTDANTRRVLRFDRRFDPVRQFDDRTIVSLRGSFQPVSCATGPTGILYILDADERRIITLDGRGVMTGEFCANGSRGPSLSEPKDIAVDDEDHLLVLDGSALRTMDRFGNDLGTIRLDPSHRWSSVSCGPRFILVIASDAIAMIRRSDGFRMLITSSSLPGMGDKEPFADASSTSDRLDILTEHRLLRCLLP